MDALPMRHGLLRVGFIVSITLACLHCITTHGFAQFNWLEPSSTSSRAVGPRLVAQLPSVTPSTRPPGSTSANRRIRFFPRSSVGYQVQSYPSEDGRERIAVIHSGVNIVIDHVAGFDTVDLSADRIVIWTSADQIQDFQGDTSQASEAPLEFYMEGNIVFRQQDRVIYAERMYYNVRGKYGVILDGELLTPIPGYQGLVRLKADVLRQVDPFRIEGFEGAATTSRLGVPSYWLQSGTFTYENPPTDQLAPSGLDPLTGQPEVVSNKRITSRGNRVFLGHVPIFYWPFMSANLDRPTMYLEAFNVRSDQVFGTQVLTEWNLYHLLGFRGAPTGTQWTGTVDYLSKRGWGFGTNFEYDRKSFWGHPGRVYGFLDAWGIRDNGLDNLGRGRRALVPETNNRGRILGRHRQYTHGLEITGELGWISDRNFLEQYYEWEWDQEKNERTGLEIKHRKENRSASVSTDVRINDFFTQTNWLPRADHYWIAQPLLSEWLSWTEHSSIGYGHLQVADAPEDPAEAANWTPMPWEADRQGGRATTRHRIDAPFQWRGGKIVPYVMGEAAYWEQDLNGDELTRLTGQAGVRASIPFVRLTPNVHNSLFNINGIAHKIVLEGEFLFADSDADLADLPLYDQVDDDAIEFFRRQFSVTTFGGPTPLQFDERYYLLRSGFQRWVTASSAEIADDLTMFRLAAKQRWQTKRGMPGQQRVVDWIALDVQGNLYPNPNRDNFGQTFGLLNYDFRWHVGDRFTVLSDAQVDFFAQGLRTISLAGVLSRPGRMRYAGGFRSIGGPINSNVLYGTSSMRLSPKWIATYSSSYDFGSTGNLGQRGQFIRVGESFLVGLGATYDHSRDNFAVRFSIEPRFLSGSLSRAAGIPIPPVGAFGLE